MQAKSSQRLSKENLNSWYTRQPLAFQCHFRSACASVTVATDQAFVE